MARLNTDLVQHEAARPRIRGVTLDIDSSESPVHGRQEESAYNGHFESVCHHPLFLFNQDGDCLAATLRPGNVHSADGWEKTLLPVVERPQARGQAVVARAAAACAIPALYKALERGNVAYAIRRPGFAAPRTFSATTVTCASMGHPVSPSSVISGEALSHSSWHRERSRNIARKTPR